MRQHLVSSLEAGFAAHVDGGFARSALEAGQLEHEVIAQRNAPLRNVQMVVGLGACFQTSHNIFVVPIIPFGLNLCQREPMMTSKPRRKAKTNTKSKPLTMTRLKKE